MDHRERKYINVKTFVDDGYLHEVNRQFFHPLGLALAVNHDDDDEDGETYRIVGIWDERDDPEGIAFDGLDTAKMARVAEIAEARRPFRVKELGSWIQTK